VAKRMCAVGLTVIEAPPAGQECYKGASFAIEEELILMTPASMTLLSGSHRTGSHRIYPTWELRPRRIGAGLRQTASTQQVEMDSRGVASVDFTVGPKLHWITGHLINHGFRTKQDADCDHSYPSANRGFVDISATAATSDPPRGMSMHLGTRSRT